VQDASIGAELVSLQAIALFAQRTYCAQFLASSRQTVTSATPSRK